MNKYFTWALKNVFAIMFCILVVVAMLSANYMWTVWVEDRDHFWMVVSVVGIIFVVSLFYFSIQIAQSELDDEQEQRMDKIEKDSDPQ